MVQTVLEETECLQGHKLVLCWQWEGHLLLVQYLFHRKFRSMVTCAPYLPSVISLTRSYNLDFRFSGNAVSTEVEKVSALHTVVACADTLVSTRFSWEKRTPTAKNFLGFSFCITSKVFHGCPVGQECHRSWFSSYFKIFRRSIFAATALKVSLNV